MNNSPYKARIERNTSRRSGNIEKLELVLWKGVERAEAILQTQDDVVALKAIHSLATIAGSYLRAVEVGELEARLREVEESVLSNSNQK